jgi:hypothetical protein
MNRNRRCHHTFAVLSPSVVIVRGQQKMTQCQALTAVDSYNEHWKV